MKSELPFFKFHPDRWIVGDITLLSYEAQGLFINVCSYYWKRECNGVAIGRLKARYRDAKATLWDELIDEGMIKLSDNEEVIIDFLDEQMEEITQQKKYLSEKGKEGASKRWGGNSNKDKEEDKEEEEDKNKDSNEVLRTFELFWEHYHITTGKSKTDKEPALKHWKKLTTKERDDAINMVHKYKNSVSDPKYIKKARTYLADKNFNDELKSSVKLAI